MAPREIAYDLSLHIYSPPFANTSRIRLSIKHISLYHDSRPFFFSERKVHISVRAAATAHSLSSLRKAAPIGYNISFFFFKAFCTVIYIAILRRDGFEALGGMDDAAECRRAVDADLFEFVSVAVAKRGASRLADCKWNVRDDHPYRSGLQKNLRGHSFSIVIQTFNSLLPIARNAL